MANEKSWCSHIKKLPTCSGDVWHFSNKVDGRLQWIPIFEDWSVCPVKGCCAIRPEEPKALWEVYVDRTSSDRWAKEHAWLALKWFRENLPEIPEELRGTINFDATFKYLRQIEKWIDQEIKRCQ